MECQISQYQTDSSAQHLFWSLPPYRDHFSVLFITSSGLRTFTSSSIGLDFHTLLSSSWSASPTATNSKQLNDKLKSLARAITLGSKERVGNITLQLQTCRDFIGWTDRQVSIRSCSIMEKQVLALIKRRLTQLSVQEEERRKQRAHFKGRFDVYVRKWIDSESGTRGCWIKILPRKSQVNSSDENVPGAWDPADDVEASALKLLRASTVGHPLKLRPIQEM